MTDKRIYQIGLTMIEGVGDVLARQLLEVLGDAEAVFVEKPRLLEKVPGIGKTIATKERRDKALSLAEKELAFVEKNHIALYFLTDADYPKRLFECPDAPVLFYFKGNADLNAARVISVVGTRRATAYGQEQTEHLLNELSRSFPDLLVVSGLAYGIDICAHRSALKCQLPTVGVLAHGLDRIYPPVHRATAVEMLAHGGLLTDFPMDTNPDRQNFVRRNRIVAGLADAIIVVESAEKGGSLITADLALSYGRDIFTFPGRVTDPRSKGCNALIRQNKAGLITCAEDLILSMRWDVASQTQALPQQTQLLFSENQEGNRVLELLIAHKEMHINELALSLELPIQQLSPILFELEVDGKIKSMPGGNYKVDYAGIKG